MNVKHLYKRINRGIVLGIILLIGLAAYIWKNESDFKREMPAIEQTITSYVEESAAANTFSPDLQKIDADMSEQQQTDKMREYTALFDKYWAESDLYSPGHIAKKSEILQKVRSMITENSKGKGYVRKITVLMDDTPTVKKAGPYDATALANYKLVVEYAGSPYILLNSRDFSMTSHNSSKTSSTSEAPADATPMRQTIGINGTIRLSRINGEWKIMQDLGGSGYSNPVAIEE